VSAWGIRDFRVLDEEMRSVDRREAWRKADIRYMGAAFRKLFQGGIGYLDRVSRCFVIEELSEHANPRSPANAAVNIVTYRLAGRCRIRGIELRSQQRSYIEALRAVAR
jgi:hypothetical protein